MGEVWAAENTSTGAAVAIKRLRAASSGTDPLRFRQEARLAAQLSHRNIVRVYDLVEETGGELALVMERLHGETLESCIARAPLDAAAAIAVGLATLAALEHAHRRGVIHRDVKPANLFLAVESLSRVEPKLLDFGIARPAETSIHTLDGTALGTPEYMSPEQIRDAHDIDGRSDLFSLAIVLYEAMTGVNPFRVPSAAARIGAVLEAHVDPDPRIPPRVWLVLARALAKRADERPANAGEFRAALEAASDATPGFREASLRASVRVRERVDQPLRVDGGEPFLPSKGTARARRRWLTLAIGSGLVTFAAAGAWLTRPAERSPLASAARPSFTATGAATIGDAIAPPSEAGAPAPTASAQAQIASVRAPERAASAPRAAAETQRAPAKPKPVATTPGF
jgi:serine/threonine-protein kinase